MKYYHKLFLALALCFLIGSIIVPFLNINDLPIDSVKISVSGEMISLAGTMVLFAALIYQIKEYRLQLEELKKSVEAQVISATELENQRKSCWNNAL